MKICILGWYGTETLGDRAILAGLLNIFHATYGVCSIQIGSLFPFLTKRTLLEDAFIYNELAPGTTIDYFEVKNKSRLDDIVSECDFVVMGGGPIMDLIELEIIAYAFRRAKSKAKKTAILGCGIGPLQKEQFIDVAASIFKHSDLIILRDARSLSKLNSLLLCETGKCEFNACVAHDPAILPVGRYRTEFDVEKRNKVAVNFREFPSSCFQSNIKFTDIFFSKLLTELSTLYDEVDLVPMHTFYVGGDDRYYLSKLKLMTNAGNIKVIHKPMNLYELFYQYSTSDSCIGMRYHSVVFQTLLNGNNFIFDYTENKIGKINSFLEMIDNQHHYKDRYLNLQDDSSNYTELDVMSMLTRAITKNNNIFTYDDIVYSDTLTLYKSKLLNL